MKSEIDLARQRCSEKGFRLGHQATHVKQLMPPAASPAESQELLDHIAAALAGAANSGEMTCRAAAFCDLRFGKLNIAEDCRDDIVEIMRNAAGESTDS